MTLTGGYGWPKARPCVFGLIVEGNRRNRLLLCVRLPGDEKRTGQLRRSGISLRITVKLAHNKNIQGARNAAAASPSVYRVLY